VEGNQQSEASLLVSPVGEAKPNFYSSLPLPIYHIYKTSLHHTSRQEGKLSLSPVSAYPGLESWVRPAKQIVYLLLLKENKVTWNCQSRHCIIAFPRSFLPSFRFHKLFVYDDSWNISLESKCFYHETVPSISQQTGGAFCCSIGTEILKFKSNMYSKKKEILKNTALLPL